VKGKGNSPVGVRPAALLAAAAIGACFALVGCDSGVSAGGQPTVLAIIGRTGGGPGEFLYPRAIDLAADGTLYVADKTGRIQHLAADGTPLGQFRMPVIDKGFPTGLSVGPDGNIWVADTHCHRVMVFSPDGEVVREFGSFGTGDGQFIYPTDVVFCPDGRVLVSEYGGNDRISVWSADGKFQTSFGKPGSAEGEFARPAAMAVDAKRGILYVADACNHRVAKYTFAGQLMGYVGALGQGPGQLRYPYGLALEPDGTLTVCEYGNNRVQKFGPDGQSLGCLGQAGREAGELAYPWGVAVDSHHRLYVVDAGNNRLQAWRW
jgi:DNA-binding beta-propeller fold protein YncE